MFRLSLPQTCLFLLLMFSSCISLSSVSLPLVYIDRHTFLVLPNALRHFTVLCGASVSLKHVSLSCQCSVLASFSPSFVSLPLSYTVRHTFLILALLRVTLPRRVLLQSLLQASSSVNLPLVYIDTHTFLILTDVLCRSSSRCSCFFFHRMRQPEGKYHK